MSGTIGRGRSAGDGAVTAIATSARIAATSSTRGVAGVDGLGAVEDHVVVAEVQGLGRGGWVAHVEVARRAKA